MSLSEEGRDVKNWWQSYRSKLSHGNEHSIANDEASLLAERLQFFVPKLMSLFKPWQWLLYIVAWATFLAVLVRHTLPTWSDFSIYLLVEAAITALTVLPAMLFIDYLRPTLQRLPTWRAGLRIVLIMIGCAIIAQSVMMLIEMSLGLASFTLAEIWLEALLHALFSGVFTLIFLMYFLRRYQEMVLLKMTFDEKLAAQNDLIKARIAPHFFFNTINTLVSLVESNPARASELLQHVSALFRASFGGPKEINFEEEVALCEHYLAIESCRLADKLVVEWDMPDDDTMYDMVITALTLQSVVERLLLNVVEMTTETIHIRIKVTWNYHRVEIQVSVTLPMRNLLVQRDLQQQINFEIQSERLQLNFGQSAFIKSQIELDHITTIISYPLHDAGL